jgi:hypothetical protein
MNTLCHIVQEATSRFPNEKAAKGGIFGEEFDSKVASDRVFVALFDWLVEIFQHLNVPKVIDCLSLDVCVHCSVDESHMHFR